jgi:Rab-GTPase-TBC domain
VKSAVRVCRMCAEATAREDGRGAGAVVLRGGDNSDIQAAERPERGGSTGFSPSTHSPSSSISPSLSSADAGHSAGNGPGAAEDEGSFFSLGNIFGGVSRWWQGENSDSGGKSSSLATRSESESSLVSLDSHLSAASGAAGASGDHSEGADEREGADDVVSASDLATECARGLEFLLSTFAYDGQPRPCLLGRDSRHAFVGTDDPARSDGCRHILCSRRDGRYFQALSGLPECLDRPAQPRSARSAFNSKENTRIWRSASVDGAESPSGSSSAEPPSFVVEDADFDDLLTAWAHSPLIPSSSGSDKHLASPFQSFSLSGSGSSDTDQPTDDDASFASARTSIDFSDTDGALPARSSATTVSMNSDQLEAVTNKRHRASGRTDPATLVYWVQLLHRPLGAALRARMFAGLPAHLRILTWAHLSGADCRLRRNPDIYAHLAAELPDLKDEDLKEPPTLRPRVGSVEAVVDHLLARADMIIAHDAPRTFPDEAYFQRTPVQFALTRLLRVYARYNPHLGYEQGMNCMGGIILLACGGDEEVAFWIFVQLMEHYDASRLYNTRSVEAEPTLSGRHTKVSESHEMSGLLQELLTRFDDLVRQELPELHSHLERIGADLGIPAAQWFRTLMTHCLSCNTAMRVMDAFIAEGFGVMLWITLAIMQECAEELMEMKQGVHALQFLVSASTATDRSKIEAAVLRVLDSQVEEESLFGQ